MSERILFISPCTPRPTGNGLAMRAAAVLDALGQLGTVSVAVRSRRRWWNWFGPAADWPTGIWPRRDPTFSRVHVFRLSCVRWAEPYLGHVPCDLDLDECESAVRQQLGLLSGNPQLLEQARFYQQQEQVWLPRMQRVFVSSRVELGRLPGINAEVLPNTITPKPHVPRQRTASFRLLFVGTLNYEPNRHAVLRLVREIFPLLDERFELRIVGGGWVGRRQQHPRIHWAGFVEDLDAEYHRADALVVPLQAGGGTRIKILEALSYGVPVVATAVAVEGLNLQPGSEILLAESALEFQQSLEWLALDEARAAQIGGAGRHRIESEYVPNVLVPILRPRP